MAGLGRRSSGSLIMDLLSVATSEEIKRFPQPGEMTPDPPAAREAAERWRRCPHWHHWHHCTVLAPAGCTCAPAKSNPVDARHAGWRDATA